MNTALRALVVLALLTFPFATIAAAAPDSASVAGVTNTDWPDGISEVAAFGQLLEQRDGAIQSTDVVVWSGLATSAFLGHVHIAGSSSTAPLVPTASLVPGSQSAHPIAEAAVMAGANYTISYLRGGKVSPLLARSSSAVTLFATEEQAVAALKDAIAVGNPVVVDVDFFDIFAQASASEPKLTKQHQSVFLVVTGYDVSNVTFTDNRPSSVLGGTGENVTVPWWAFRQGWRDTKTLQTDDPVYGPNFMLTLMSDPQPATPEFVLASLGASSRAPVALNAAAAFARHATPTAKLDALLKSSGIFTDSFDRMCTFAAASGEVAISDAFDSCSLQSDTLIGNEDGITASDTLKNISSIEGAALAAMRALGSGLPVVELVTPDDALAETDLFPVTFRWRSAPTTGRTFLQISATGDFADMSTLFTFPPRPGTTLVVIRTKDWPRILAKVGVDRTISWRVVDTAGFMSDVRTIVFDVPAITSVSPNNGFAANEANLPLFSWTQSVATASPRVVISTVNSFADKRTQMILLPRGGQTQLAMTLAAFKKLEMKDTSGTAFWRVEDGATKITGVQPSATRSFTLP